MLFTENHKAVNPHICIASLPFQEQWVPERATPCASLWIMVASRCWHLSMSIRKSLLTHGLPQPVHPPPLTMIIALPCLLHRDEIRRKLPEYHLYVTMNPELAGDLTRKEAGFVAEILSLAALEAGKVRKSKFCEIAKMPSFSSNSPLTCRTFLSMVHCETPTGTKSTLNDYVRSFRLCDLRSFTYRLLERRSLKELR